MLRIDILACTKAARTFEAFVTSLGKPSRQHFLWLPELEELTREI